MLHVSTERAVVTFYWHFDNLIDVSRLEPLGDGHHRDYKLLSFFYNYVRLSNVDTFAGS